MTNSKTSIHNKKAVLLDFDGTIVDSVPLWIESFYLALKKVGIEIPREGIPKECFNIENPDILEKFGINTPANLDLFRTALYYHHLGGINTCSIFSEMKTFLIHCNVYGIKVSIVSSSPRTPIESWLKRNNISDWIDHIVAGGDYEKFKPHPEPVLVALDKLNLKKEDVIFFGDSESDRLAGEAAGVETVIIEEGKILSHLYKVDSGVAIK